MGTPVQWQRHQVAGPGSAATTGAVAVLSRTSNNIELWWPGSDGAVHGAAWYADGTGWRAPYPVPGPVGPSGTGGLAAASRMATTMEAWWVGADTSVRGAFWYDNGNGWQPYGDPVAVPTSATPVTGMAALSRIDTSMEIWWVGFGGTVQGAYWYAGQNNDSWQRYTLTGPGQAAEGTGIAAVSRIPTGLEIWWVGPSGSVEGGFWYSDTGQPWQRYQVAPAGSAVAGHGISAVSRTATSMDLLWITPAGGVAGAHWNEGAVWQPYPAPVGADGSAAAGLAAVAHGATGMDVYWITPDGSVQGATWTAATGWQRFPDAVAPAGSAAPSSGLAAHSRTGASTEVCWIGPDGSVQVAVRVDAAPEPFSFRILRPVDLVDLTCDAVGCQVSSQGRLTAVTDDAHLVVHFGIQHINEEAWVESSPLPAPRPISDARAANPSRVVFNLPAGTAFDFTAAGVLAGLTTLGLRVAPLAVPAGPKRPPGTGGNPAIPAPDQTAIEAPYRLVVSPDGTYGGFTHAADPVVAQNDSNRVELWHSRLAVRGANPDPALRTVRPIWTRDTEHPTPDHGAPGYALPGITLPTPDHRIAFVAQSAGPVKDFEPVPFTVDRLYLSALGAWLDWQCFWGQSFSPSAYRHQARGGRDQYVRVELPIYLFPFGHLATLVLITERKIDPADPDAVAYLRYRNFIVLRQHTVVYTDKTLTSFPFSSVTIDPVVSPDFDVVPDPSVAFVPQINVTNYPWKITAVDHAGRTVTMATPLVAVPIKRPASDGQTAWVTDVLPNGLIDVGDAEVAFASERKRGDSTSRVRYLELAGAQPVDSKGNPVLGGTCVPSLYRAHITIPAVSGLNPGGGGISTVGYADHYKNNGFDGTDQGELYLVLDNPTGLNFGGSSDRGGGFIAPSVSVGALSRTLGAVGDNGTGAGGITTGQFDPTAFFGDMLPKLFGLIELTEIIPKGVLDAAPKLIADQLGFIVTVAAQYKQLTDALQQAQTQLTANANGAPGQLGTRYTQLSAQIGAVAQNLAAQNLTLMTDALQTVSAAVKDPNPAALQQIETEVGQLQTAVGGLAAVLSDPDLPVFLRSQLQRFSQGLTSALSTVAHAVQDVEQVLAALRAPMTNGAMHFDWSTPVNPWPQNVDADHQVFAAKDPAHGLDISVDVRTGSDGGPQTEIAAQLGAFSLTLMPGTPLMSMNFGRLGFRVGTGGKPEVDVIFDGMSFLGPLAFIDTLRKVIPLDGFSDPPYVDISPEGATAGFDLALPTVAIGVFSLANISIGADCRVPFLGDAVTVGFNFCTKESPFRLTVMAIGGGGWVGIRLSPTGLVLLEMGLEAGAALAVDLGVASGSVSVMVGVYLRLEDGDGQLTGYFRIRGEVEVLKIASASITLELSLTYDTGSGKLVGRASIQIQVELLFFSMSVEVSCEKKLAGSGGDPSLIDVLPPGSGGQGLWNQYFAAFGIGA
jgi:hypothetical protein